MAKSIWKSVRNGVLLSLGRRKKTCAAVILAAGKSTRMENDAISKQMLLLDGMPAVVHSLLAFEKSTRISEIVVVSNDAEMANYRLFKQKYALSKLRVVTKGGATRAASAAAGFRKISKNISFVAIHDAARCLITTEEIDRVIETAYRTGAAIASTKVSDTIKRADEKGFIAETPEREGLWAAQTPQVFLRSLYQTALALGEKSGAPVTDDASLAERAGFRVKLVPCSPSNLKMTTPSDIAAVRGILSERKETK